MPRTFRTPYHNPSGDPCTRCNLPAKSHRVEHQPLGDPCRRCGLHESAHYRKFGTNRSYYVGIDGEGQGRTDHRYVMLAWSNEDRSQCARLEAPEGGRLSTTECLDFILATPANAKLFAYAFNYDLTKILQDCPDDVLYRLFHPQLRQRSREEAKKGPRPVPWGGYMLNLQASKFTVSRGTKAKGDKVRRVIWDVFKFFQSKFTIALDDWKVGDREKVAFLRAMKDKRADFDNLSREQILDYCYLECQYMATLARVLTEAHVEAGKRVGKKFELRSYYGAGSTASVVLKSMHIDKVTRNSGPPQMQHVIPYTFFGGRFEHSVIGCIPGPVYGYDISSAYPYQLTFLPCLEHGKWTPTTRRRDLDSATTAMVRYALPPATNTRLARSWGPFPFRTKTGSIVFPASSGGGWVWLSEYLAGEALFPNVRFMGAWVYRTSCDCRPFADIPKLYLERLRIGKEGPGIVIKLGTNACYGKLAQSVGINPPFQSWIWAGMITAGTRAQILAMLARHKDPRNMLMVATDGIYTTEDITTPAPLETGTLNEYNKPLGGWEKKIVPGGMFAARPGVYFPLHVTDEEIKDVRARGVGRAVLLQNRHRVIEAFNAGAPSIALPDVTRFQGAKSSIGRIKHPTLEGQYIYNRFPLLDKKGDPVLHPETGLPMPRYGQWTSTPVEMSFNPLPKREAIHPNGRTLIMRKFGRDDVSSPYSRTINMKNPEIAALRMLTEVFLEQPEGPEWTDYETDPLGT